MTTFSDLCSPLITSCGSQDSCSTISSEGDCHHPAFSFRENVVNPLFKVYVGCAVKAKEKIIFSEKIWFGKESSHDILSANRVCGMFEVDRKLYQRCWYSTSLGSFASYLNLILDTAWSEIAAYHAELHFHYTLKSEDPKSSPRCSSIDFFDLSGHSVINNVPLHPFRRTHFQLNNEKVRCDERGNKGIELWVHDRIGFFIFTEIPNPSLLKMANTCSVKHSIVSPKGKKLISPKKTAAQKKVSKPRKEVSQKPHNKTVIYTSGIRLSKKDLSNGKKYNILLNPDFHRGHSARILVANSYLKRSVKLLTVLPHIEHIVQWDWLKKYFIEGPRVLCQIENYPFSEEQTKGSIEKENGFSLNEFLRIPTSARETLLSEFVFWLHPKVEPQVPPINDIKTVILHSGGKLSESLILANVFLLPSLDHQYIKEIDVGMRDTGKAPNPCFAAVTDQLFKCILRQEPSLLTVYSLPL